MITLNGHYPFLNTYLHISEHVLEHLHQFFLQLQKYYFLVLWATKNKSNRIRSSECADQRPRCII